MALKTASTAPRCDICNHGHWKHEAHIWPAESGSTITTGARPSLPRENAPKLSGDIEVRGDRAGSSPSPIVAGSAGGGTSGTSGRGTAKKSKASPPDDGEAAAILAAIREKTRLRVMKHRASKKGGG